MQTTKCPVCQSDVVIEEGLSEKDLVSCLNCATELEISCLHPLRLVKLEDTPNSQE